MGCAINSKHKGKGPKGLQFSQLLWIICQEGGGGGLRKLGFKIIFSKSNSITFYRSLGMRNQVETQRERSQGNSIQQNYMYYLPRGWPENNRGENNLLQIQFYHVQ